MHGRLIGSAWILNLVRYYSLARRCNNHLVWRFFFAFCDRIGAIDALGCNSNFPPLFLSSFSPPTQAKPTAWKKCREWQRFGAVGCKSHHIWVASLITNPSRMQLSLHVGIVENLRSNPSYMIKSINFGDFPKLVEDNVRKYHDARRQPALLATVSPSTAKHTAVAFIFSCWICLWSDAVGFAARSTKAHLC